MLYHGEGMVLQILASSRRCLRCRLDAFQHGVQPLLLHFVIGVIVLHHVNKELLTIYSIYDIVQFAKQLFILYQIQRVNLVAILLPVQQIYQVEDATVLPAEVNLQRLFISNKKETIISIVLSVYVYFFYFSYF